MKVLLSAIACNPVQGSEGQVGWNAAKLVAREHRAWVITDLANRKEIENARLMGVVSDQLHFVYHGEPFTWHPNRMIARCQSWWLYMKWNRSLLRIAQDLHNRIGFDLAQHVTYASWRVASPLWKLNIPFVWGPIGGNERIPMNLITQLSPAAVAFELARSASGYLARHSSQIRSCARNANQVLATNRETAALLSHLRGDSRAVSTVPVTYFGDQQIARFTKRARPVHQSRSDLRIFAGGNLEGRKGVALALRTLAQARERGLKFSYLLAGRGPERRHLQDLVRRLNLSDAVRFEETLTGDEYPQALADSDVYFLPSFRESTGITLMEAMLSGCVPVVADCGGPGEIVTDECGVRISIGGPSRMITQFCEALLNLSKNPGKLEAFSQNSVRRIRSVYSDAAQQKRLELVYHAAIDSYGAA